MSKKRPDPSKVAILRSNRNWFDKLTFDDQCWILELIKEISKVEDPSYYTIANCVIETCHPEAVERNIVRFLKQKVMKCREENQAKS